ncbi:MAG: TetR/AcrR family transcriptional regulator [Acetobacteraceae bacterium]|nr:TetR/AcrR family transcriptional regulator [Acetobacteraceae bacterium]
MDQAPADGLSPLQARKRAAILDGARTVFLRDGFGGSSMDEVARAAGVGKQTVYRHFGSKEALFEGLLAEMCGSVFAAPALQVRDLPGALREIGRAFVQVVTEPANLALFRIVVAEAGRFPKLARRFHETGVAAAVAYVAGLLARETGIKQAKAESVAATFLEMVKGPAFLRFLLGAAASPWNDSFEQQIEQAVAYVVGQVSSPKGANGRLAPSRR